MSVRDDFIAFCEAVGGQPLTPQQRLLAEVLSKRFMQGGVESVVMTPRPTHIRGHKAGLLIVDDREVTLKEHHEDK